MREETVFMRGRSCNDCLKTDGRLTTRSENEKRIMKELHKENNRRLSFTKHIEMAQTSKKSNINTLDVLECQQGNNNQLQKLSLPKVTITTPFNDGDKSEAAGSGELCRNTARTDEGNTDAQKSVGKIAGRRALPEITITCPQTEASESQEDESLSNGIFTRRRYMVCKDSPRSGKKTISLVDFPHCLSELEVNDSLYPESPANSLDSPYSFSNVDLSFTYSSPLGSPFTPPFTPEMARKPSKFIYPGPVPVFTLEESFPPAKFEDDTANGERLGRAGTGEDLT